MLRSSRFPLMSRVLIPCAVQDVLKVKGNQVAPAELEVCRHFLLHLPHAFSLIYPLLVSCVITQDHLLAHPDVLDACVVGVPDERAGELPFAFIVLQPKARSRSSDTQSLKRSLEKHVEEHKIRYKWLKGGVVFVDTIPKVPSGKILVRLSFILLTVVLPV